MLKKRGRKPKNVEEIKEEPVVITPITEFKKRGRKSSGKIIECTSNVIDDKETIIGHLPLSIKDLTTITPSIKQVNVKEKMNEIEVESDVITQTTNCKKCKNNELKMTELMKSLDTLNKENKSAKYDINIQFIDIDNKKWDNLDLVCWYCCHKFETKPVGLPEKIYSNKYYTIGYFCSLSCAFSYNIYYLRDTKTLERTSLLNKLHNQLIKDEENIILNPAPPREMLKMFGGTMTIEHFRNQSNRIKKEWRIIIPPMTSIAFNIEEFTKKPIDQKINELVKSSDTYILKRNKPRINEKRSLEKTFGIQIFDA